MAEKFKEVSNSNRNNQIIVKRVREIQKEKERMHLPRYFVLKSNYNGKFLRYVHEDIQIHGFLQFSGDEAVNPYAKMRIDPAKCGKGLIHLRCCYNNKYWGRWSKNHWWVTAAADEPVEDTSDWSCTLFKPVFDAQTNNLHLLHVQLNKYANFYSPWAPFLDCLFCNSGEPVIYGAYSFIDWESLLILPKHVTFKGDNGEYLSARWIEGHQYHQYASKDIGDPTIGYQVYNAADGSVRIKSNYFGKFWRRSPNWIWADSTEQNDSNPDTLFWPIKVDNNVVALRNMGNKNFCKRLTTEGKTNCLNAGVSSITNEARMEVVELVYSRKISDVVFRPMDSRIYNQSPIIMAYQFASNQSTDQPLTVQMKFTYTEKITRVWNTSVSLKLGVKTTFLTGIPFIAEGKIEFSAEVGGSHQWGETQEESKQLESTYTVVVKPMTNVKVSLIATRGTCDVPFSYTQRDTLTNGEQVTHYMDDGVFTGMNCYNYHINVIPI